MPHRAAARLGGPRSALAAALLAVLLVAPAAPAHAAVSLAPVGRFLQPTYVTAPRGDPHRVFVTEKGGAIWIVKDGVRLPRPFLTVPGVTSDGELGLLSMAFPPDYATSGRFYVYYATGAATPPITATLVVDEFRRSASDLDRADPGSRRNLLTIGHPGSTAHDGGQLQFGPDGYLYVGTGDSGGGSTGAEDDPDDVAQNTGSLLGKLLRIDPRAAGSQPYGIPPDNPFRNGGGRPEIWAYGLRNPWRFSFDRLSGDLAIADVGASAWEEVDFASRGTGAGADYGWRCMEGPLPTPGTNPPCTPSGTYAPPAFAYEHAAGRCAITGGYVVRDPDLTDLLGRYVYGDFCSGELRSVRLTTPLASDDRPLGLQVKQPDSFGEDACGHVYLALFSGPVYRLAGDRFTPCPAGAPEAVRRPGLGVTRARVQHLRRGYVQIGVRCDERCTAVARGTVAIATSAHVYRLRDVRRVLAAGSHARLRLRLRRAALRSLRHGLSPHGHAVAHVSIVAWDAAGNRSAASRRIRVLR